MKKVFLFLFLLFSCTDSLNNNQAEVIDFRDKSYENSKHVGSYCSENCIWSKYAVEMNVQEKSMTCVEGDCACVVTGDIYTLCDTQSDPSEVLFESSQQNYNVKNIPYYSQYDNKNFGWATCQNTSIAMVLSYYENNIHPDTIYNDWGKDFAQSPSGLNRVYNSYANSSNISTFTNSTPENLRDFLNKGFTAIVHGYFTSYGHVLVVKSFDGEYYHVNDPAGVWQGCFKCGYNGSYNGVTKYPKNSFENAVFTSDGYSYLPGWIHIIRQRNNKGY